MGEAGMLAVAIFATKRFVSIQVDVQIGSAGVMGGHDAEHQHKSEGHRDDDELGLREHLSVRS
jgi:hypothetical protein